MLRLTAGAAAGVALPGVGLTGCSEDSAAPLDPADSDSGVTRTPLPIPDTLVGPVINLEMRPGAREFLPDRTTLTKGYNRDYLGPTLVLRSGSDVSLNVTNNIANTRATIGSKRTEVAPSLMSSPEAGR